MSDSAAQTIEFSGVSELLTLLVDKSLVVFDDKIGRYRLLETIRQYSRDRLLEAQEGALVRDRHVSHFLALAKEAEPHLSGAGQKEWAERLEAEHENLGAALDRSSESAQDACLKMCGKLWRFWQLHGHYREGRRRCEVALSLSGVRLRLADRAKALRGAGMLAYRLTDYVDARSLFAESLEIGRELDDKPLIANPLSGVAMVERELGNVAMARALFEESLLIYREVEDRGGIADVLGNLGVMAVYEGNFDEAGPLLEESLAIMRELHRLGGIAVALANVGDVACAQGNLCAAVTLFNESLLTHKEVGNHSGIPWPLEGLAAVAAARGQGERAARLWGAANRLRTEFGIGLPTGEVPRQERHKAVARAAAGIRAFDAAWQEGRSMTLDKAIEYALQEPENA
jgi:tetratricopeptide (TPR) repeat protein